MNKFLKNMGIVLLLAGFVGPGTGNCQTVPPAEVTTNGVVASSSSSTLVVRTETGQFILFVYSRYAVKPATVPSGATVTVTSYPREDGVQAATNVLVRSGGIEAPATPSPTAASSNPATVGAPPSQDVIPESVRDLENDIKRQSRRFGAGIQGGVGLDPSVILVGLTARMGPILNSDITFRPSVDFGFGEVTKMFQINLDAVYRLPLSPRTGKWSAYLGAGPNFSFVSQNFERAAEGDNGVDFSDFSFKAGLNVIGGIEYRSGVFYELKAGVWTIPTLRIVVGYRF